MKNDQRDDAITWLTSLPERDGISAREIAEAYVGGVPLSGALGSFSSSATSSMPAAECVDPCPTYEFIVSAVQDLSQM
jgi:hypothetical protein